MKVFEPFELKNLRLKNRLVMPPMCMYSAVRQDGKVGPFHLAHYADRAWAGVGLIIVEATGILPEGRISDECLGLWTDDQVAGMTRLVEAVHAAGGQIALQINHAGRKARTKDPRHVAPSALPYNSHPVTYEEMTGQDIDRVLTAYAEAARRAHEAGFDGLEIHGAHGYLIHQFLSPLSNQREDEYGRNRALFLNRAVAAVDQGWPRDKALWIRISASDWLAGSVTPQDWIAWLKALPRQMDMVHVSSGALQRATVHPYPGYMLPLSQEIKKGTGLPVIGVGFLDEDQLLVNALESGQCDLVALGRELLRNPNKLSNLAVRYRRPQFIPQQYQRAYQDRM